MTLRDVYEAFGEDSEVGATARRLIEQQHWYNSLAEYDPKTGQALPLGLDEVLRRLAQPQETVEIRDRLWRIAQHSRASVERLFSALNESPRREQATLPIRSVRELNAGSLIALNRRPGRNVREKLAGNPYMQAVRRFQSIDLPENRLLKEYASRLAELLELRAQHLHVEDPLLPILHRWLHTDEAEAIGRWGNLPPNNTLLSQKDYRRVWDAWRWLQTLDEDTDSDLRQVEARAGVISEWQGHAAKYTDGTWLFGGTPVLFDHESFSVRPWMPRLATRSVHAPVQRATRAVREDESVCVDLTDVRPRIAVASGGPQVLPDAYVWQRWQNEARGTVDIELFEADFPMLWRESTTISAPDLFYQHDLDPSLADLAAHAFARRLRSCFRDAALTWLIPDHLNEFDLGVVRRNLNARFPSAEPLPRSVAAVFDNVDHRTIKGEGFTVLVVDDAGGVSTATRLVAKIDTELAEHAPFTRGYYWERTPSIVLSHVGDFDPLADIAYVGADGRWRDAGSGNQATVASDTDLRANPLIEHYDALIRITTSPVAGGTKAHELQLAAGGIPIWRDHIPELSIKVHVGARYQSFYLVDKHTTIRPIRGLAVEIPVRGTFTLPAGRAYYKFPLFQGSDASDLGFEARLDSPAFPLTTDTPCRLTMTYTYGADEPYRLVLTALDDSIPPMQVKWRVKTDEAITDAPGPGYPTPLTWDELQHQYNPAKQTETDYLDWAVRQTDRHLETLGSLPHPVRGVVKTDWKTNANGKRFMFVEQDHGDDVYVGEFDLARSASPLNLRRGDEVHLLLVSKGNRTFSRHVAPTKAAMIGDIAFAMRRGLYVPYIKTWSDGRTLSDPDCPTPFRVSMGSAIPRIEQIWMDNSTPEQVRSELRFLFCCMHRDMPQAVSRDLVAGATAKTLDERAYAFALGDLSQAWQNDIFRSIWNRADSQALGVLAQAIWRTDSFVRVFDAAAIARLSDLLLQAMRDVNAIAHPGKAEVSRATQYCELLLGLLRSRESDVQEVRLMLQPHQERTRLLADQVELAADLHERSGLSLRSRVEISDLPDKPEGDRTPDLLYALRLYLTGDVGANAIRVTGVLDGEDD